MRSPPGVLAPAGIIVKDGCFDCQNHEFQYRSREALSFEYLNVLFMVAREPALFVFNRLVNSRLPSSFSLAGK